MIEPEIYIFSCFTHRHFNFCRINSIYLINLIPFIPLNKFHLFNILRESDPEMFREVTEMTAVII